MNTPQAMVPARRGSSMRKPEIQEMFERLRELNPHPTTELEYTTPFELLIAVLL
ncbi:endonuclease III, partial [Xanthomonas perforans]|nr:endonuclease III [Xanthomonas perforans]